MAAKRGYVTTKWLPPPTIDDYMYEVELNVWWNERERAKRQLIWLMEIYLGESDVETKNTEEKAALCEVESRPGEEGENDGVECH